MNRTRSSLRLALTLGVLSSGCSKDAGTPADPTSSPTAVVAARAARDIDQRPVTYAVIGDVPYGSSALASFPSLISAINQDQDVELAVHVGDIKSGSTVCSDAWFQTIAADFATFADPLVYAIGDNEWTDCHRANNGGYNPLDRLAKIREIFFSNPGYTLGGVAMPTKAQKKYPENQRWTAAGVVFASLHIIGSNNGLDPWFGDATPPGETPEQTTAREKEVAARNEANIDWLEDAFQEAKSAGAVGVVLFFQADLWHPEDRAAGAQFTAHTEFVHRLAKLAASFKGQVLLVSGDSHDFRVDAGVPWFSLYGAKPQANVTQVIVDRSIEADIDSLKLRVDPTTPGVFSWQQLVVP